MHGLGHRPPPVKGWQALRTTTTLAAHRTERLDKAKPNSALPNRCRRTVAAPFSMGRRRAVRVRRSPRSRHKERILSCSQATGTRGTRRTHGALCSVRWLVDGAERLSSKQRWKPSAATLHAKQKRGEQRAESVCVSAAATAAVYVIRCGLPRSAHLAALWVNVRGCEGGGRGVGGCARSVAVFDAPHSKRKLEHENSRYAEVKPVGCNAHVYSVWNPEDRHLICEVRKRASYRNTGRRRHQDCWCHSSLRTAARVLLGVRGIRSVHTVHTPHALPCCRGGCSPAFLMCVWLRRPLRLSLAAPPHAETRCRALCYTGGARPVWGACSAPPPALIRQET